MPNLEIDQADVGTRATIRVHRPDGGAQDFVGWIVTTTPQFVTIETASGTRTRIDVREIFAARRLPFARGGRSPSRETVERVIEAALPSTIRRVEGWSQLKIESPDVVWLAMTPDTPISTEVLEHANSLIVVGDSPLERTLLGNDWLNVDDRSWDVYASNLNVALSGKTTDDTKVMRADAELGKDFARVDVLSVRDHSVLANGTCRGDWVSINLVSSDPPQGTAAVLELCRWAARYGARNAVAAVPGEKKVMAGTFQTLGFALHHRQRLLSRAQPQAKL